MGEPSSSSGSGSGNGGSATGTTADSYIGSLISLTSKSEIRYEGILYTIDTQNSNIALQDVRSFGTEGRKKDGPQIPPSDKVYDYIIFRGSDIKDLQVKSSPPAQTTSQIHSDPAIISLQSQYSQPSQASNAFGAASGSLPDLGSHGAHSGVPSSPFRGGAPLFQATRNLGSWGSSPVPPGANGTGLALPMYWQGYYGPATGLPHVQQQPLHFQPPPGMPIPPTVQQHLQQSAVLSSLPTGLSTTSEFINSLQQTPASALRYSESSTGAAPIPVVSISSTIAAGTLSNVIPMSLPLSETLEPIVSSDHDVSAIVTAATSKPRSVTGSTSSLQSISQTVSVSTPLSLSTSAPPTLVTPGQLLQPGGSVSSLKSQSSTQEPKVTENSNLLSQPVIPAAPDSQPQRVSTQPLLPLPTTSSQLRTSQQVNVAFGHSGNNHRGRGRGRGRMAPHASTKFTEDFDFTAMNEKFKKDEVWGHLGKSELKDKVEEGEEDEKTERNSDDEENSRQSSNAKPVYVKDDFFDSLSCDALDRSRNDRRFSEQRKIDTETFGSLPRSRSGRGGRGSGYRGNFRGSYYGGRGNGYIGRGRGGGRTFL